MVITRDRRRGLLETLSRLDAASSGPVDVVVVDNGSSDGTARAVREQWPDVTLVQLPSNRGAGARNVGVEAARAEVVAFSDDDSWWAPGALDLAVDLFAAHPRLGLLAARVLVGPEERLDPVSTAMAESPLPRASDLPGPSVLGFVACGSVVRRSAYLAAGGFDDVVGFGGEETRLAIDLAVDGWGLAYVPAVVAHHDPDTAGPRPRRRLLLRRNEILSACMRRPWGVVAQRVVEAPPRAVLAALPRVPAALVRRRQVPADLDAQLRLLEGGGEAVLG